MRLWTIQHRAAYERMMETATLRADPQRLFCEEKFLFAYDWLSAQMRRRLGPPPEGVRYPVWAWYQWEGARKRPDMRIHRKYGPAGTPIALLHVDAPDERVLLSDFDMWHNVLNRGLLPLRGEEDKDTCTREEMEASWENIFQYNLSTEYWPQPKSTQATLWEIKAEWVKKAEFFLSG